MRAYTIQCRLPADKVRLFRRGDKADVGLITAEQLGPTVTMLLWNVEILDIGAVDQRVLPGNVIDPNVRVAATLLVTPQQVAKLNRALTKGGLTLSLPGGTDPAVSLAPRIPSGMLGYTIQGPEVGAGVTGFILPGNRVDVLLAEGGPTGGSTSPVVQNAKILAVEERVRDPKGRPHPGGDLVQVTLVVTPAQAAELERAQKKGRLRLTTP